ncbi:prenyltransferase [Streptomyces litchfieldiae]|uniref:Prenyltransferase n=1 Tax=Streptomyces litchfieldiae TaxID=3075543 RepID=A0ABU2MIB3_9ACTN|nr:prenyltransferase [Streptomyces sp. DSM 44938]MDT0341306.1 prenyltransferase [Streptomyces sp. DSM 44938]
MRLGRPKFLFQSLMVVGLGVTAAQHAGHELSLGWYLGALLFAWLSHLMTHYCNEYFDLEADRANEAPTSWTGGSRVLVSGLLPPVVSLGAAFLLLFAAVFLLAAMPDTASRVMAAAILAASWFYTAPPLKFNYRALGEVVCAAVLYGLGPLLVFRLQAGGLSASMCAYVGVVFAFQFLRMSVMNLSDQAGDRRVGKRTLAVALGPRGLVRLYVIGQCVVYASIVPLIVATVPLLPGLAMLATFPVPLWVARQLLRGALTTGERADAVTFWASMHMPITAVAITLGLLADLARRDAGIDGVWLAICGTTLAVFAGWFTRAVRSSATARAEAVTP